MSASIAAAKGIEPCPMCGSDQVRWRRRRPTDFVLTWARWGIESAWANIGAPRRVRPRADVLGGYGSYNVSEQDIADVQAKVAEANTGRKTPKRFWRCKACRREGHVF